MTATDACPLCGVGLLVALLGTVGWLRCPACNHSFDGHGHGAYDVMGRFEPLIT